MSRIVKLEAAILYLASKLDAVSMSHVEQLICAHNTVQQVERYEDSCECKNCSAWMPVEEYRLRLANGIPGVLVLTNGTKEYKCRGV